MATVKKTTVKKAATAKPATQKVTAAKAVTTKKVKIMPAKDRKEIMPIPKETVFQFVLPAGLKLKISDFETIEDRQVITITVGDASIQDTVLVKVPVPRPKLEPLKRLLENKKIQLFTAYKK